MVFIYHRIRTLLKKDAILFLLGNKHQKVCDSYRDFRFKKMCLKRKQTYTFAF